MPQIGSLPANPLPPQPVAGDIQDGAVVCHDRVTGDTGQGHGRGSRPSPHVGGTGRAVRKPRSHFLAPVDLARTPDVGPGSRPCWSPRGTRHPAPVPVTPAASWGTEGTALGVSGGGEARATPAPGLRPLPGSPGPESPLQRQFSLQLTRARPRLGCRMERPGNPRPGRGREPGEAVPWGPRPPQWSPLHASASG